MNISNTSHNNRKIKILAITGTPRSVLGGYSDIVGQTLHYSGNAYFGFKVILKDGSTRDLACYYYAYVDD